MFKLAKAIRSAFKYAKHGGTTGYAIGAIFGAVDDDSKSSETAATGLAIGTTVGAVIGIGISLTDDHYRRVYEK